MSSSVISSCRDNLVSTGNLLFLSFLTPSALIFQQCLTDTHFISQVSRDLIVQFSATQKTSARELTFSFYNKLKHTHTHTQGTRTLSPTASR